ncbi:MAG: hypothetical protein Crog4KO_17390 [Crocinitomicaceae bacterium]
MRFLLLTYLIILLPIVGWGQITPDTTQNVRAVIPDSVFGRINNTDSQIFQYYNVATGKGRIHYYNFDSDLFSYSYGATAHSSLKPTTQNSQFQYLQRDLNASNMRPLFDFNGFGSNPNNGDFEMGYRTGAGVQWQGYYKDQWNIHLAGVQGIYDGDSSYRPRAYFNWREGNTNLYTDLRSRISFSPNKIFNFQAGIDHNFIGEGSRSLFLSDYGNPYPFGLIRAEFWRLEYVVLYQFMREGSQGNWNPKFSSSHHISFNAAPWLNIGVFETVIFNPRDTLLNRGFEVEYLNPVVFYRPQEYAVGSADNVLLGLDLTSKLEHFTLYSQFIIDEFFLSEIRERTGWWANKFGGQLGVKANFSKGDHLFFTRAEMNFVRPYTYTHLNDKLNHGNQGRPLAHPYGANFAEVLGEVRWAKDNWRGHFFVNYAQRGGDTDSLNYGADIYLPYINRPYERGHFIGQGNATHTMLFRWRIARKLPKVYNVSAFAEYNLRYTVQSNSTQHLVSVGLRTNLWNDYRNY